CDTEWEWTCGWYLARFEAGVNSGVPASCQILVDLIPKPPQDEAVAAGGGGPTCSIVYTTSTNLIEVSASWGSPFPGQMQAWWTYPCGGSTCVDFRILTPTQPSLALISTPFLSAPSAHGTFEIQDWGFTTIFSMPCPLTIIP
ncbi:MAG: hypothetical protein K8I82_04105, partial [Anaerolineae bacterium]|nr:hypothetical protein [Anaerolineae bacterium]